MSGAAVASHDLRAEPRSKEASPEPLQQDAASPKASELLAVSQPEPSKLASPALDAAAITPPPSSQPRANRPSVRTPTPQTPHLSSPPPTLKEVAQAEPATSASGLPTAEQITNAGVEELRAMVGELSISLREARMSSAHYKLQYNMLSMDSTEASNRMAVELALVQREVDVLQEAEARRRLELPTPGPTYQDPAAANATLLHEMSRHCSLLQQENEELQDLLAQSRRSLERHEGQVSSLLEENELLRSRIKKNREHMNGFLDYVQQHSPQSMTSTPHHTTPRARTNLRTGPLLSDSQARSQQPFEALLLADKVLSQESPSTPGRAQLPKHKLGHRAAHSLSSLPLSLPSTPQRARITAFQSNLRTPPTFAAINGPPRTVPTALYSSQRRRRNSSDSTITASSVGDGNRSGDDEIPESQASQAATSMLRRTPLSKSQASSKASSFNTASGGGGLKQTKLFGQITKPGVGKSVGADKRRMSDVAGQPSAKRARLGEGVGLGIMESSRV